MDRKATPRPKHSRIKIVNETKMKLLDNRLENDTASKILWRILDKYYLDGEPVHTELNLQDRYDLPRKYVIDLYGDYNHVDTVLIRALTDEEINRKISSDLIKKQSA